MLQWSVTISSLFLQFRAAHSESSVELNFKLLSCFAVLSFRRHVDQRSVVDEPFPNRVPKISDFLNVHRYRFAIHNFIVSLPFLVSVKYLHGFSFSAAYTVRKPSVGWQRLLKSKHTYFKKYSSVPSITSSDDFAKCFKLDYNLPPSQNFFLIISSNGHQLWKCET